VDLNQKQRETKDLIEKVAPIFGLDPSWPLAMAMTESSLGIKQLSPTGCRGVFQMSSIAMKDLLREMTKADSDIVDVVCGIAFLYILLKRHGSIVAATSHFCDPNDIPFYLKRVKSYMKDFSNE